ncbi:MAG: hypothetical protein AAF564_16575 [Bacteroidota bacterium]
MASSNFITSLGIPTRNRPDTVARCLQSFVDNAHKHSRDAAFTVVDDNKKPEYADATRRRVDLIRKSSASAVRYLNRADRRKMAAFLSRKAKLPQSLLEYALLGNEQSQESYGAARNTLLLASAGTLHVQVDDDTICELYSTTQGAQQLIAPTTIPTDRYQFYQTRAEALAIAQGLQVDVLGLHEAYLGKPLSILTDASPHSPDMFIVGTFLGAAGDSGMSTTMGRLSFQGAERDALLADPESYRWKLFTRNIIRAPRGPRIGVDRSLITINAGLDNRTLLPPFPPNMRNEDSVFGEVLGLCQPNGIKVHLPFTIQHDPPNERPPHTEVMIPPANLNQVLSATLSSFGPGILSSDPAANLPLLGTYLQQLVNAPLDEFVEYVSNATRRVYAETLKALEAVTEEMDQFPAYYQEDVTALRHQLANAIDGQHAFKPIDLWRYGYDVWEFAQSLFGRYAELLKHWPAIADAAKRWHGDWQD